MLEIPKVTCRKCDTVMELIIKKSAMIYLCPKCKYFEAYAKGIFKK